MFESSVAFKEQNGRQELMAKITPSYFNGGDRVGHNKVFMLESSKLL